MRVAFYKSIRPGIQGIYSHAVRWWTRSPYSHCELVFADGTAASSSYLDGGVRFKQIEFDQVKWDFVDIEGDEIAARLWFHEHAGRAYDLLGNVGFVLGPVRDAADHWSCAESVAAALGYPEPWRYSPAILHSAVSRQPASAGFLTPTES
jgi:hypothetical protein